MTPKYSRGFHWLSIITLVVGILLIWIGAAVTTTDSGMAFSDWPFSNGSINPHGWLYVQPQFLEHSHRLLATTVGLLVLTMFIWQWLRAGLAGWVPVVLVSAFLFLVPAVHAADAMTKGVENKLVVLAHSYGASSTVLWMLTGVIWGAVLCWLFWGLLGSKWSTIVKLTAGTLVVVVAQALLGGLRVLEVSDPLGMAHGTLGQLFYCLLVGIALVGSPKWSQGEILVTARQHRTLIRISTILFAAVSLQLLFGAIVRHSQRVVLAASDVLTTGGHFIPPTAPFDVFSIFMHKAWGLVVFALAISAAIAAWKPLRGQGWASVLPKLLILLPIVQVTLGVYVLLTVKKFWVTNIHVLNGLGILAVSFLLAVTAWRTRGTLGLIASETSSSKRPV